MDLPATAQPPAQQPKMWLAWLDDVRGLLALYILLHHATLNIDASGVHDGLWSMMDDLFGWGHFRVDIFFVLSGFCLALPMQAQSAFGSFGRFLLRRSARLLPPYYAALSLSLLVIFLWIGPRSGTHWDVSVPVSWHGLFAHLLLVHQWWPGINTQINHPLWSIGVEYQLYFLFPLLLWVCRRVGPWLAVAAMSVLAYALWRYTLSAGFPDPTPWGASIYYVSLFTMGIAAADLYAGSGRTLSARACFTRTSVLATVVVSVLMVGWALMQWRHFHAVMLQVQSYFVGLAAMSALVLSRAWPGAAKPAKPAELGALRRFLRFVGARSYSLYLLHAPLLQLVWLHLVRPLHMRSAGLQALVMVAAGSAVSLVATVLFYEAVESPSHRWSRRIGSTVRPVPPAATQALVQPG